MVIANRYVSANQIHQGGKIKDTRKRNNFLKWLDEMEYEVFGIPRPDITFYLSLPTKLVLELIEKRSSSKMQREYLKRGKDVHESDVLFMENSVKSALWLAKRQKNMIKIDCSKDGEIISREKIHDMIYAKVKKIIK